ncbi:IS110 family transposase [Neiella sp. HB171785]|uniref:IS110 family transposase n=1 Tax=Neiella litorisoli TaxID=2771431 RepID=A0A8J6UQ31_9GAMM|nr:IS110 family transposase [Neiella litorisoli]MBD1390167.1 IS110 family transposase [Neiella litorisoli]
MSIQQIAGLDLAKNVFSIHVIDLTGKCLIKKTVKRSHLLELFANMPPTLVGMEACSGAHYWARELLKLGHDPKIIPVKYVAPYCTGSKNDANDARAICEAVTRPHTRFVTIKSPEQQALMLIHRARQHWVQERTALINQIRAYLTEFGLVIPKSRETLERKLPDVLEDADNQLPDIARALIHDCYHHLLVLNQRINEQNDCFGMLVKASPSAQRIMKVPGVGAQTATAILASIGKGEQFDKARDFAAWLGLVPRQYTTGGKVRMGRISKKGNTYIRTLLVDGARAVIANCGNKTDRLSIWVKGVYERRGYKRAIVALAAKNARIIWAMLNKQADYQTYTA